MLATNILIIIYILFANVIILTATVAQKNSRLYFFINNFILLWELYFLFFASHYFLSSLLAVLYHWSPLILLPILHKETHLFTNAFGQITYDNFFISLENKYFPFLMPLYANNHSRSIIISEFLHLCYLSFYLLIYGIPLFFYINNDLPKFHACSFAVLLLLLLCYLTHVIIPACGPRNIFEKITDHRSCGVVFRCVHKILESGSIHGTAFPSGHVGVAVVILLITLHFHTVLFLCTLPFTIGIIVCTIYGRFHYLIDAIFGAIYAITCYSITMLIY